MVRTLFILSLGVIAGGCLAIRDADDFQEDPACDLLLPLRNFDFHSAQSTQRGSRQRFTLRMIRETVDGESVVRTREAVAVFDPIPAPSVDVFLPRVGVPAVAVDQRPLVLEFFADLDLDGAISVPDADHSWIEPHLCSASEVPFVHNTDFLELAPARNQPIDLHIVPTPGELDDWRQTVEVRIARASVVAGMELVTSALYRRAEWDFASDGAVTQEEQARIEMPGVLRDSEDAFITVFIDRNSDGDTNAGDYVFMQRVTPLGACTPDAAACALSGRTIEVTIPLRDGADVELTNDVQLERWWTIPE